MKKTKITKDNLKNFAGMLPVEVLQGVALGNVSAIGMKFSEMEAGAAAWVEVPGDSYGRLVSLFVPPEFRDLDVGHVLLQEVIMEMGGAKKEGISFRYQEEGDRKTLTPFFNVFGFQTDVTDIPLGQVTLKDAKKRIDETFKNIDEAGVTIQSLRGEDRRMVADHIRGISGLDPSEYLNGSPDSFVILEDKKIKGLLLFSLQEDWTLNLDYFFSRNPKDMAGMLKNAITQLLNDFNSNTNVEMLLTTQEGQKLYNGLFGEPGMTVRVAECRQSFKTY